MPAFLQPIIVPTATPVATPDPGTGGGTAPAQNPQLVYPLNGVSSYLARHGLSRVPQVKILTPTGEEVLTNVYHSAGQTALVFSVPFTGTLYLE